MKLNATCDFNPKDYTMKNYESAALGQVLFSVGFATFFSIVVYFNYPLGIFMYMHQYGLVPYSQLSVKLYKKILKNKLSTCDVADRAVTKQFV